MWILVSEATTGLRTHDGLDRMSRRVVDEILAFSGQIPSRSIRLTLVGHSLGGLIARHVARFIPHHARFIPHLYVSIGTPHLGVRISPSCRDMFQMPGLRAAKVSIVCTFGITGRQLHREDDTLWHMSLHSGDFMRALNAFSERIVIGHVHDDPVPYCSSTIQSCYPSIPVADQVEFRAFEYDGEYNATCGGVCDKNRLELDARMLQELSRTPFRRITLDYGTCTRDAHMALIGYIRGPPSVEFSQLASQTVHYIVDLIIPYLT